jgi:2-polyprenyl-3-methyl-5-hydroxy-6-metoxy-1,4-benzoquinol methylase
LHSSSKTGDFFDKNVEFYGGGQARDYDLFFVTFIKSFKGKTLLDIGGGAGAFAALVKQHLPDIEVTVVDPSQALLEKIGDKTIKKINGDLPNNLNLTEDREFDVIHVKEVLHHVVDNSVSASKKLLTESLQTIANHLADNGHLMIHEPYYESYFIPPLTRNLIFYLLRVQNSLRVRIPISGFLKDLQVCFYTRDELLEELTKNGFCILEHSELPFASNFTKKAGLLKKWGRVLIIAKKVYD